jgi:hypothetical protein
MMQTGQSVTGSDMYVDTANSHEFNQDASLPHVKWDDDDDSLDLESPEEHRRTRARTNNIKQQTQHTHTASLF